MKKIKESLHSILLCLGELAVGVLLLINPTGFTSGIIIVAGCLMIALGIWAVVRYIKAEPHAAARDQRLFKGLALILGGLFCALNARWFILTFPVLTMVYAVALLLIGLLRIQWTADALRLKNTDWRFPALGAALAFGFAVVILINPFASTAFMWIFVGLSMICEAAVDLVTLIFKQRKPAAQTPPASPQQPFASTDSDKNS